MDNADELDPKGHVLHQRIAAREDFAVEELWNRFVGRLESGLGRRYQTATSDEINDAITETIMEYIGQPEKYQPHLRSLVGYLWHAAERDLQNLLAKRNRRPEGHLIQWPSRRDDDASVEESDLLGNIPSDAPSVEDEVIDRERAQSLRAHAATAAENDVERIVLDLILDGERGTDIFIERLGWGERPTAEARKEVFRLKDRLLKRLQRQPWEA